MASAFELKTTLNFTEAVSQLKDAASKPARKDRPERLPLSQIKVKVEAFQPRLFPHREVSEAYHVKDLISTLKAKPPGERTLDPLLVFALGNDFVLIDGHHRYLAYRELGIKDAVPVEHFEGPIDDAIMEAAARNSKDRLPMDKLSKSNTAWRLTLLDTHTKMQVSEASGVSERTVATMRSTLKQINEAGGDVPNTWDEARRGLSDGDQIEFTDELRDRMVRDWARKLKRAFGNKAAANSDILADAIEQYSASLPMSLITTWRQNGHEPSHDDLWGGDF